MTTRANSIQPAAPSGAALYVDTENLGDPNQARQVVASVVADWPGDRPPLGMVSLYVRADKAEMWRLWSESAFPALSIRVRGVQHFSANNSKNSADLAITADAVADLMAGMAHDVAVVSNDSDFGALFVKVRELAHEANAESVPFLWITAPDGGAFSAEIAEFIPETFRWDLSAALPTPANAGPAPAPVAAGPAPKNLPEASRPALTAAPPTASNPSSQAIAEELVRRLPVGKFKVAEALVAFQDRWPRHPAATGPAQFGTFLLKEVWPFLQKRGVLMARKTSPRAYEITQAAKDSLEKPPSEQLANPSPVEPTVAEPTIDQLAASIAGGINDDEFKSSEAQDALKRQHPAHPAASYTAPQFGVWFAKQVWPVMEQHGVLIAKEKPRLYEMTPDARHRLTSLA